MEQDLRDIVLNRYQQQIAKSFHAVCRATDPGDLFNQLNNVLEALIKTIATLLHAYYRSTERQRDVDLILDGDFLRPSIASYHALGGEILRATAQIPHPEIRKLAAILRDDAGSEALAEFVNRSREFRTGDTSARKKAHLQRFFDEFVQFRHKVRGHGAPTPAVYEQFNIRLLSALDVALRKLEAILIQPLVAIQRIELEPKDASVIYEVTSLNGLADLPSTVRLPLGDVFLSRGDVYVHSANGLFQVSPLLTLATAELAFLNEFRPRALAEYLVHHTGALKRVVVQLGTREFFDLPTDLRISDIRSRNGIVFNLPRPTFNDFVGRENETIKLRKALERRTFPIVTLWGWGGSGKTALALKLAYDLLGEIEDSSLRFDYIVWISAKKTEFTPDGIRRISGPALRVATVLQEIARVTGATDIVDIDATTDKLSRQIRQLFEGSDRILVIVDNFETFEDDKGFAWEVFKDVAGAISFLVTSRHKRGEAEQPIHLAGLPENDALNLLESEARAKNAAPLLAAGSPLRRRVIRECDSLPLAIKTVVGWVTKGVAIQKALEGFKAVQAEGIHEFCFEESYDLMTESDRLLAYTMAALGEPASRDELHIVTRLALASIDASLEALDNLSIVEITKTDDDVVVVQMPNLPRDYFQKRVGVETAYQRTAVSAAKEIIKLRLGDKTGRLEIPSDLVDAGTSARLAYRYAQLGEYAEADRFWGLAVEANPGHSGIWARKGYYEAMMRGEPQRGLQSLKKALMLKPEVGHWWFVRGIVERKLEQLSEAMECFEKARELGEEPFLVDANIAIVFFEKARLEYRLGNRALARKYHEQVVELANRSWSGGDDTRAARHNAMVTTKVARSLIFLGRIAEAVKIVERARLNRAEDRELEGLKTELDLRMRRATDG